MITDRKRYAQIVFLQGDEADEALAILDEDGDEAVVKHLSQWDYGCPYGDVRNEPSAGTYDRTRTFADGYILTWNTGLNYIGLEREVVPRLTLTYSTAAN